MHLSGFTFKTVDGLCNGSGLHEAIFRLRYQVYVNEWGFEKPEDHPGGLEKDCYDHHSRHFYASHGSEKDIVGTARLILPSCSRLPIQEHFDIDEGFIGVFDQNIAEVSRLAISKEFRRRAIDRVIFNKDKTHDKDLLSHQESLANITKERRKYEHELIRGFYLTIHRESLELGLTHWCAVMAKGLHVMLNRWGIHFEQVGPEKEYHGVRAPYLLSVKAFEESMKKKNPDLINLARQ